MAVCACSFPALEGCRDGATPPSPPQGDLILRNATVVTPGLDRREQQTLVVQGSEIVSVEPTNEEPAPLGARREFDGSYALPGLIDMHVHYPIGALPGHTELWSLLFLAHGVTTVREVGHFGRDGTYDGTIFGTRRRLRDGELAGPRMYACGPLIDGAGVDGQPLRPGSVVVRNEEEARRAVADLAAADADCIKAYSLLTPPLLTAIRAEAERHGLPVIGHVPTRVSFEEALLADVQHLEGVADLLGKPFDPSVGNGVTQFWVRFTDAWREVDAERIDFIVRTSLAHGIAHTPTMTLWSRMARMADYAAQLADPAAALVPTYYARTFWHPQVSFNVLAFGVPPERLTAFGQIALPRMRETIHRLHAAGARIHLGTDVLNPFVVPGASAHEELGHLVEAGLSLDEAWAAATWIPGEFLGEPLLGRIEAGAPADLLIFREDPTQDADALATLEAVVVRGALYRKADLDEAVAQCLRHAEVGEPCETEL